MKPEKLKIKPYSVSKEPHKYTREFGVNLENRR